MWKRINRPQRGDLLPYFDRLVILPRLDHRFGLLTQRIIFLARLLVVSPTGDLLLRPRDKVAVKLRAAFAQHALEDLLFGFAGAKTVKHFQNRLVAELLFDVGADPI